MSDSPPNAGDDLRYIRDVLHRTEQRVDPHAFHYVHWGAIVLVWYPLATFLAHRGRMDLYAGVGIAALALGVLLSVVREKRLSRHPRLEGGNTFLARQVARITFLTLVGGIVLGVVAPATGFVAGPDVPVLWGLTYAVMATMIGVVYRRSFLYAGVLIFAASLAAMALPAWNGYILGPAMGLGLMVPGLQAERRVRAMRGAASLA